VSVRHGDTAAALVGERTVGMSLFYLGDHTNARRHAESLLARYTRPKDRSHIVRFQFDPRIVARTLRSKLLWAQGFPDQAMEEVQSVIEEATGVGHAMSLALALAQGACPLTILCGEWQAAERYTNLLLEQTLEHALDLWHGWGTCFGAMTLISRGDTEAGLKTLREALDDLPEESFFVNYAGIRATLAEALGRVGAKARGHATIDQALMRSERDGECWYLAEFLRVKGELLRLEDTPAAQQQAETYFQRSLECARQQETLSWKLRTATSLARLYQGQGQLLVARDTLEPVYGRFSEGFETADLKVARALINDLR
jgi:tetratricopeptide (TPR) repeat protein